MTDPHFETIEKDKLEVDLRSLGVEPNRINTLNDTTELQALVNNLKQTMYEDYKLAYSPKGEYYQDEVLACTTV